MGYGHFSFKTMKDCYAIEKSKRWRRKTKYNAFTIINHERHVVVYKDVNI